MANDKHLSIRDRMQMHQAQLQQGGASSASPVIAQMKRRVAQRREKEKDEILTLSDYELLRQFRTIRTQAVQRIARKTAEAVLTDSMSCLEKILKQTWHDHLGYPNDVEFLNIAVAEVHKRGLDTELNFSVEEEQTALEHQYFAEAFVAPA